MAGVGLWLLLVLFACLSIVSLVCSVWVSTSVTKNVKEKQQDLVIRGPMGPPGKIGPQGPEGQAEHFQGIHHWNIPWQSENNGAFLQFEGDMHGFYCAESGFGQITLSGDMQVRNPPNGRHSLTRKVKLWLPHEGFDREHDWDIDHRTYTGWRSSDTIGAVTHDDQEDFEVFCLGFDDDDFDRFPRPELYSDERLDRLDRGDRLDFGRDREDVYNHYHGDFPNEGKLDRELDHAQDERLLKRSSRTILVFNVIVTQGDEQVGLTPWETVLPLRRRRPLCRVVCE
jgi:hypothetical protein